MDGGAHGDEWMP